MSRRIHTYELTCQEVLSVGVPSTFSDEQALEALRWTVNDDRAYSMWHIKDIDGLVRFPDPEARERDRCFARVTTTSHRVVGV